MEDGTGGDGDLIAAVGTLEDPAGLDRIRLLTATPRASSAVRPTLCEEETDTVFLGGKAFLEFEY